LGVTNAVKSPDGIVSENRTCNQVGCPCALVTSDIGPLAGCVERLSDVLGDDRVASGLARLHDIRQSSQFIVTMNADVVDVLKTNQHRF
jgi:hypothetical protein